MDRYSIPFSSDNAPTIDIKIGWSMSALKRMLNSNGPGFELTDPEIYSDALIDTGAHRSFITHRHVEAYDLKPTGFATVHSPLSGSDPIDVLLFPVSIRLMRKTAAGWRLIGLASDIEAGLLPSADNTGKPIIGRDVLSICTFIYDGPRSLLTLHLDDKRSWIRRVSRLVLRS